MNLPEITPLDPAQKSGPGPKIAAIGALLSLSLLCGWLLLQRRKEARQLRLS